MRFIHLSHILGKLDIAVVINNLIRINRNPHLADEPKSHKTSFSHRKKLLQGH